MSAAAAAALAAALAPACSTRTLVVVDPDPCADGGFARGVAGCPNPDPCADGGVVNGVPGCVPPGLLDALIGYWRLDDATGTIANDWSGRGNHGTLVGLTGSNVWAMGRAAGALNVAANGFVNVPRSASIDSITDAVTVSGWIYYEGPAVMDYATAISREIGTTIDQHYHIAIAMDETPTAFIQTEAKTVRLNWPQPVARASWVHIAATYDGTVARLYVNGLAAISMPITGLFMPETNPVILGGNGNGVGDNNVTERFPGRIDEIMLYRRALSAEEIAMLHDGALFPLQYVDAGARD